MLHVHFGHTQYLPIALPLFALLAGALALLLILVQIRVLRYAYTVLLDAANAIRNTAPRVLLLLCLRERFGIWAFDADEEFASFIICKSCGSSDKFRDASVESM